MMDQLGIIGPFVFAFPSNLAMLNKPCFCFFCLSLLYAYLVAFLRMGSRDHLTRAVRKQALTIKTVLCRAW